MSESVLRLGPLASAVCILLTACGGGGSDAVAPIKELRAQAAAVVQAPLATSWQQGLTMLKPVIVRAKGTPGPDGVCPVMRVSIYRGEALLEARQDSVDCTSGQIQEIRSIDSFQFQLGDRIDVQFVNDAAVWQDGAWTQDRNLYVESIQVGGLPLIEPTDPGVTVEWGDTIGAVPGADVGPGQHWLGRNGALHVKVEAGAVLRAGTVLVRASSERGLAQMNVRVDGRWLRAQPVVVGRPVAGRPGLYLYPTGEPIPAGAKIDVVYSNDDVSTPDADENLHVESVWVDGGGPIESTAPDVHVDWGSGGQAFDGIDTSAGQTVMARNGALRFVAPARPVDASGLTTAQKLDLGRVALQLTRLKLHMQEPMGWIASRRGVFWSSPVFHEWLAPIPCSWPPEGIVPSVQWGAALAGESTGQREYVRLGFDGANCQAIYDTFGYHSTVAARARFSGNVSVYRTAVVRGFAADGSITTAHAVVDLGAGAPSGLQMQIVPWQGSIGWSSTAAGKIDYEQSQRSVAVPIPGAPVSRPRTDVQWRVTPANGLSLIDDFSGAALTVQAGSIWGLDTTHPSPVLWSDDKVHDEVAMFRVTYQGRSYDISAIKYSVTWPQGAGRDVTDLTVMLDGATVARVYGSSDLKPTPSALLVVADGVVVPL